MAGVLASGPMAPAPVDVGGSLPGNDAPSPSAAPRVDTAAVTAAVDQTLLTNSSGVAFATACLRRHEAHDWGDVSRPAAAAIEAPASGGRSTLSTLGAHSTAGCGSSLRPPDPLASRPLRQCRAQLGTDPSPPARAVPLGRGTYV